VRHWPRLEHFIAVAILLAIGAPIVVVAYVKSGIFDTAAARPHSRLMEWITHETMINSVKRHAPEVALPTLVSRPQAAHGFCTYEAHCVACHGAPAVARAQWVSGLNPQPPYLIDATQRWKPRELRWIVSNGIKMTGMPAWRQSMSESEIDAVVAFLAAMPKMPPQTYVRWRNAGVCGGQSSFTGSILGTPKAHQSAPKAATAAVR
jgi:cytochrome c553